MAELLNVQDLRVHFHIAAKGRNAVDGVSFSLEEGEILGLVGESGCGKTTLSRTILGMLKDYDGEIVHHSVRPQMVFQDPFSSLNPARSIGWILEEPLRVAGGMTGAQRRAAVLDMLDKIGLGGEFASRRPWELSGGQRQRVSIAAAMITRPKLIIADEPVSALDVTIQTQILELLKKLNREHGMAILFISHNLHVVQKLCTRVAVMQGGHLVETGLVQDIFQNPRQEYTRRLIAAIPTRNRKLT